MATALSSDDREEIQHSADELASLRQDVKILTERVGFILWWLVPLTIVAFAWFLTH